MSVRRLSATLACLLLAACRTDQENAAPAAAPATPIAAVAPPKPSALPPALLQQRLQTLAGDFDGQVGVAVKDLGGDWVAAVNPRQRFPQQSVMKVWLAVAVLDAVDRGEMALSDTILLERQDLSLHHQPIKGAVLDDGRHLASIEELLRLAVGKSDNAATDALIRRLGGSDAVEAVLARKGLAGVRIGPEERVLHTRLAGLVWRADYAYPQVFDRERQAVPTAQRRALLEAYLLDPWDGATPPGLISGLQALKSGRLLSPESTARLLTVMSGSNTGRSRLRAGLEPGWLLAHKTGTGPDLDAWTYGYNDMGLLTAPDGRVYAVAAMIAMTGVSIRERQTFLSSVSRAVVTHWKREQASGGGAGQPMAAYTGTSAAAQAE